MELTSQVWIYIVTALLGTGGGTLLAISGRGRWAARQVGAWMAIMVGAFFFLFFALTEAQNYFLFLLGLVSLITGAHALESGRLHEELSELKRELTTFRTNKATS